MFCFCIYIVGNAFLSSGQGTKGPDPRIRIIVHPNEHAIIPVGSFVLLHCEANSTDNSYQNDERDYENDEPFPLFPDESDFRDIHKSNDQSIQKEDTAGTNCRQEVQYEWLRNDKLIDGPSGSYVETFCNGTIKITHSPTVTGIYRCVAKTKNPDIGAIISKASTVEIAGKI